MLQKLQTVIYLIHESNIHIRQLNTLHFIRRNELHNTAAYMSNTNPFREQLVIESRTTCTHTHTRTHTQHAHTHTHTRAHTHTHTHTHTHAHTHTQTRTHTRTHTRIRRHAHTHARTHTRTHTHTHTHTHTSVLAWPSALSWIHLAWFLSASMRFRFRYLRR